ncbi:hypothetical protein F5Y09DRAFT_344648 [Xylaria sp. FL1042]|nr:hypothetical protein F5Y09DRAFT_344648 [Xylaria sp. FL1042]
MVPEVSPAATYGPLCGKQAKSIWLLQVKNGDGTYKLARGWAFALVTEKDAIMIAPGIHDPSASTGAMSIDVRVMEDDATSGMAKIACVTTPKNGRRLVPNTTVGDIIMVLGDAGLFFCTLNNGRGLRHWLCAALFLLDQFIEEPNAGEYLPQRAVNVTRHCDTGSSTMEDLPIEKGNYDMSQLSGEAKAALLLCDREIIGLRRLEGQ